MNVGETQLEAIFLAALEQPSDAERAAFLDQACGSDPAVRQRVEELLSAQPRLGNFLNSGALVKTVDQRQIAETLDTAIGPYHLREVLGEGGMGIVYAAEQEQPIRRLVALKVIKPGMDSKEVIARFSAERQALALMDHPHIAKVLDAGTTDSGRPYFVMELVRGMPITEYCDRARMPLRDRLKLFITVCQAVQHAHQKGIIHRDLKPSNVMITLHDGVPAPKVIDFGVAKALNQRLTEHTVYTKVNSLVGTPMYMSPEQAELSGLDIDTRSDVYSLGVLLYELLTGHPPFDKEQFSKAGYDEMRRVIREEEPPRPSQKVSTLGLAAATTVSEQRGVETRQLKSTLHGEIDWITMKALEKDRTQRYGSADAVAADLESYLHDRPVQACPPSMLYQWRKLLRRRLREFMAWGTIAFCLPWAAYGMVMLITGTASSPISRHSDSVRQENNSLAVLQPGEEGKPAESPGVASRPLAFEDPAFEDWIKHTGELSAKDRAAAIARKLQELNPDFDGVVIGADGSQAPQYENGFIRVFQFSTEHVSDVSPVRALQADSSIGPTLKFTGQDCCGNGKTGRSMLRDLSPLKGLRVGALTVTCCDISDLSPLIGMKLYDLKCGCTKVNDLSPLKDLPLHSLAFEATEVADLSPLKGKQLRVLDCRYTRVTDLSPLEGMPLEELSVDFHWDRDADVLRSLSTLKLINGKPAAEFWQEEEARRPPSERPVTH